MSRRCSACWARSCGLIHAFAAVATVNPAEKANLLSASISEAMNCTAFGLMTAVPMLFVHAFLQSKTTELIDGLETASVKFLNALTARQAARAQSRLELVQKRQSGRPEHRRSCALSRCRGRSASRPSCCSCR